MAKNSKSLGWAGPFKVFTVFCVIILVLAQNGQGTVAVGSGAWNVLSVYSGLTAWSVPALFMIWGMTDLESGKPGLVPSLLSHTLPAFGMLLFWSVFYAVFTLLMGGGHMSFGAVWSTLKAALTGQTQSHLWLLYPLIGLCLVHPIVHRFTVSAARGEVRYFLILCFLLSSILPVWDTLHPGGAMAALVDQLGIHLVLGWIGCYVAGWYLRRYEIGRTPEFVLYLFGLLGLAVTLGGARFLGGSRELWRQFTAPNVILTAVALCVMFRYVLGFTGEHAHGGAVAKLSTYAFGVYLFHQVWVLVFQRFGFTVLTITPIAAVPLMALLCFLFSIPFAWLLHLIPAFGEHLT